MMKYGETGLPQDMEVFKAYTTYAKNAKDFTQDTGMSEDFGIRVAQIINETAGPDPQLLSLALLSTMPTSAIGALKLSFDEKIIDSMTESARHARTGYAYIDQASDPVKLVAMASAVAMFEEMKSKSDKLDQLGFDPLSAGPDALESLLPEILGGVMPDTGLYSQLGRTLENKTSSPALEALFAEKFEEFKIAQRDQQEKLAEMGFMIMGPGMGLPGQAPAEVRYPSFEETGLLDDAKVRAVYEAVTNNPRTLPEDFEGALAAGELLSTMASPNPTTVAAALLDVGIRGLNADDFEFLGKKVDWDVIDLLRDHSVRAVAGPQQLVGAPVEFQQIVVANLAGQLDHIRAGVEELISRTKDMQPEDLPPEMQMPPEMMEKMEQQMKAQAMQQLSAVNSMAQRMVRPLFGKIDAPELEAAFTEKSQALADYVRDNTPKQPLPGANNNPFAPRKPKPPGGSISFD